MPESWSRKAAAEIFELFNVCSVMTCDVCGYNDQQCLFGKAKPPSEMIADNVAAIIERHCGDVEKALQAAAEWAARKDNCPMADLGICEENPECDPGYSGALTGARCWIEYWKKEAKGDA